LDAFEKKLREIGYEPGGGVVPNYIGPNPQNAPFPSLQPSTQPPEPPPQTSKPIAEVAPVTDTDISVWLYGVILLGINGDRHEWH
jgi:hypothetical protein